MRFCERCQSYMQETRDGFACSRCGFTIQTDIVETRNLEHQKTSAIDVIDGSEAEPLKVSVACPKCGNLEAFRNTSFFSGEHAGVRQERSIERFKCVKCGYTWTVS